MVMTMPLRKPSISLLNYQKPKPSQNPKKSPLLSYSRIQIFSSCNLSRNFSFSSPSSSSSGIPAGQLAEDFNPRIPIEEAQTPPSSWYNDPSILSLEIDRVFGRGWQAVGFVEQIQNPHDFFTGRLGSVQFVVCRDSDGNLRAFHNVCRHHASLLASGSGKKSCFVCPYHGWTYGLDGALLKATRIAEIRNFDINEYGLIPLNVAIWGPFILISIDKDIPLQHKLDSKIVENEWLGSSSEILSSGGIDTSLRSFATTTWMVDIMCHMHMEVLHLFSNLSPTIQ